VPKRPCQPLIWVTHASNFAATQEVDHRRNSPIGPNHHTRPLGADPAERKRTVVGSPMQTSNIPSLVASDIPYSLTSPLPGHAMFARGRLAPDRTQTEK